MQSVNKNETLTTIYQRKSVRNFTGASVSREILLELVKAGMAAPSAVNCQPWEFIIVTERVTLDQLGNELPYAKMLLKAGAAIVVCGVAKFAHHQFPEYAVIDATLASENILLAAEALGVGALWTAAYPYPERMETVRTTLHIPETVIPLNVIPVGQPTGEDFPKQKFQETKIHWEQWR